MTHAAARLSWQAYANNVRVHLQRNVVATFVDYPTEQGLIKLFQWHFYGDTEGLRVGGTMAGATARHAGAQRRSS
jgi:hypothetical protein